jgi:hypothetical protein
MAAILSLVTVGLLTKPSGVETRPLTVPFKPQVLRDAQEKVGSLQYWVNDEEVTDFVPVTVTANPNALYGITLICQPVLNAEKFPSDVTLRETTIDITPKDFNLTSDMTADIRISSFKLKITFAPMTTRELPLQTSPLDVSDSMRSRYRVESVRAIPPVIKVRLPVDKAETLTSLPIKSVRIAGRTETYLTQGFINTDIQELKDVRRMEDFWIRVELSLIQETEEVDGIPLYFLHPDIPEHKAELIDKMTFKVVLSGPEDMVRVLTEKPDLINVYVKLDRSLWKEGIHQVPVKCDVAEEFRKDVKIQLAAGEPLFASVRVTRN